MLKLTIFLSLVLLISQANAGIVNLAWNTGISGRTTLVFPNDTIIWTVTDSNTHTVSSDNTTFFDSGFITTNFTLNTVNLSLGSYPYHCNVHSFMTGTIVITTNVSNSDTLSGTVPSPTNTKSNVPTPSLSISFTNTDSISKAAASSQSGTVSVIASSSGAAATRSPTGSKPAVATNSNSLTHSQLNSQSSSTLLGVSSTRTGTLTVSASNAGATKSPGVTKSLSSTASGTPSNTGAPSGNVSTQTQTKSGAAQSQGATPSISSSKASGVRSKTLTGLAAIACRQNCALTFTSCKVTTRRLRPCRRAKKACVAHCGTV